MSQPKWTPSTWRKKNIKQNPYYDSEGELNNILNQIKTLPPLVFAGEVETLKEKLALASIGESFILQGGDCAERFQDCNENSIIAKLKILLQMSLVLCYGAKKPIIRIGRIAGQYAKPRSNDTEIVNGQELAVYRGDIINSFLAKKETRKADPNRILQAYHLSTSTLNYIRALTKGGFADLHNPHTWDLDFVHKAPQKDKYEQIISSIHDAIEFIESLGANDDRLNSVEFYTSHEGLLLPYEESLTRYSPEHDKWYNLGAHMLWIGDRTRQLDGAHIEYFRGIGNPIGLKVGPSADPREIIQLVRTLNPSGEEGKIILITRYGEDKVKKHLPSLVEAINKENLKILWQTDPMHGNGKTTAKGIKTRSFDSILAEVRESFAIHKSLNSNLAGIHFELTGKDVTECIGGAAGIAKEDLEHRYESYCDPRLNYSQSLEMAFLISKMLS